MKKVFVFADVDYDYYSIKYTLLGDSKYNLDNLKIEWLKTWKSKKIKSGKNIGKMGKIKYETISFENWLIQEKDFVNVEWEEINV